MQSRAAGHLGPFDDSVAVLRDHFEHLMQQAKKEKRKNSVKAKKRKGRRS